eukprot:CAMPEP_0171122990 /NCGR_PEP_ID=MMETSP0766_2-20121228/106180_1 /TAXON_ID=439317 /ORGANISM="Gambierdiscus australes, Strain CAWD 149" /LENGTH=114 /DNA_ID=CAMNT_0011585849 /DNA_START=192 /DNA_END=533 /DNA_ORIENTATION=+
MERGHLADGLHDCMAERVPGGRVASSSNLLPRSIRNHTAASALTNLASPTQQVLVARQCLWGQLQGLEARLAEGQWPWYRELGELCPCHSCKPGDLHSVTCVTTFPCQEVHDAW